MTTTPIFDALVRENPLPTPIDIAFYWDAPARRVVPSPKVGMKPIRNKRKARR